MKARKLLIALVMVLLAALMSVGVASATGGLWVDVHVNNTCEGATATQTNSGNVQHGNERWILLNASVTPESCTYSLGNESCTFDAYALWQHQEYRCSWFSCGWRNVNQQDRDDSETVTREASCPLLCPQGQQNYDGVCDYPCEYNPQIPASSDECRPPVIECPEGEVPQWDGEEWVCVPRCAPPLVWDGETCSCPPGTHPEGGDDQQVVCVPDKTPPPPVCNGETPVTWVEVCTGRSTTQCTRENAVYVLGTEDIVPQHCIDDPTNMDWCANIVWPECAPQSTPAPTGGNPLDPRSALAGFAGIVAAFVGVLTVALLAIGKKTSAKKPTA